MATSVRGTRRRSSPASTWGIVVVDAITTVAATPSVPFTTMFHAAHSPGSDSCSPSTSTRGGRPRIGSSAAKARNGTSITSRRAMPSNGTRPISAARTTRAA